MMIKLLSGGFPLHELVFFGSTFGLLLTMAVIMLLEGGYIHMRTKRPVAHLLRGVLVVSANSTFFAGIAVLPLADASAIFFVAPLMITGLSVLVLKEKVGLRRWLAVIAGGYRDGAPRDGVFASLREARLGRKPTAKRLSGRR